MPESSAATSDASWADRAHANLDGRPPTADDLTIRSHLLRWQDRYDDEAKLLQQADSLGFRSAYFDSRKAWHALPLFDRLVPRAPLDLPKDREISPTPETLEQLCFVTAMGSDQPYFNVGVELLESIRHTRTYREIPICILDSGLTEEHRHFLHANFKNLTIKDPGLDLDVVIAPKDFLGVARPVDGMKGCLARPFIPKHFPGYRYYLWMDTDTWIQDERTVDLFVSGAVRDGVCSVVTPNVATNFRFEGSWWHRMCDQYKLVTPGQLEVLRKSPSVSAGTFCIDVESGFYDRWALAMKEAVEYSGQIWGPDELTYMTTWQGFFPHTPLLEFRHNFSPVATSHGMPVFGKSMLLTPDTAEPVGIMHFCGMRKDQWFAGLIESETPVDLAMNKAGKGERRGHSIHFRTWPWQDKPALRAFVEEGNALVIDSEM